MGEIINHGYNDGTIHRNDDEHPNTGYGTSDYSRS
jgi:hypothetical protein